MTSRLFMITGKRQASGIVCGGAAGCGAFHNHKGAAGCGGAAGCRGPALTRASKGVPRTPLQRDTISAAPVGGSPQHRPIGQAPLTGAASPWQHVLPWASTIGPGSPPSVW